MKIKLALFTALLLPVLIACGGNGGVETRLPSLTVEPLAGPPGTPLAISGIDAELANTEELEAWLGNERTLLAVKDDGTLASAIPLFLGAGDWPSPPAEPQVLELRRGDTVVARSTARITVEELEPSPGASQAVEAALGEIAIGFQSLFSLIPLASDQDGPLRDAAVAMISGLTEQESEISSLATEELALVDALLASSGAVDYYETYAASLSTTQARISTLALAGICEEEGEDVELACLMQIHTVLKDFAEIVVNPTTTSYSYWVGLPGGLLAVAGVAVPIAGGVGALLSVADFIMNKLVPGLFPSQISAFELVLDDDSILVGETSGATITITATNAPPPISIADLSEQLMTLVGLKDLDGIDAFRQQIYELIKLELDIFYKVLRSAEEGFPGTFPDLSQDNVHIPNMKWGPVEVTNDRLVTLFSYEPEIAAPVDERDGLAWIGVEGGEATVRVQSRGPGAKSKLLKDDIICWGCRYYGGAFGLDNSTAQADLTVIGVSLSASPDFGPAPLTTTFSWTGLPSDEQYLCSIDPGDGSAPYLLADCSNATVINHTYATTSRLEGGPGVYLAQISVEGTELRDAVEVDVGWTLTATPMQGEPPLDVTFSWSGFDTTKPLTCTFDPGDGSSVKAVECADGSTATHTYTEGGEFAATLQVTNGVATDSKIAWVRVTEDQPQECGDLADVETWEAKIQYTHSRDVSGDTSSYADHVIYQVSVDVTARLVQDQPGQAAWEASELGGTASVSRELHRHGTEHDVYYTFSGSGTPVPHDSSTLTGSRMSLGMSNNCHYTFYLKGAVEGSGTSFDEPFEGTGGFNTLRGRFGGASRNISDSFAFPLYLSSDIVHQPDAPETWMTERGDVADMLGGDLGTVTVTWSFTAVEP
ncbi:MAG: PKD domain-containing protein [Trueperaceae bacterium]